MPAVTSTTTHCAPANCWPIAVKSTSCAGLVDQKGLTLIPLNIHLKGSWIKLTIGLGKGRKLHDKRAAEKEKQSKKDVKAAMERY